MQPLIRLGYWLGPHAPGWPDVHRFVDLDWDTDERADVALYLRQGIFAKAYMGLSECRLCGQRVGALEFSDGVYIWPQGLAHYVESHGVRLPRLFVAHSYAMVERLQDADGDDAWWRAVTSWDD